MKNIYRILIVFMRNGKDFTDETASEESSDAERIALLTEQMKQAAAELEFEIAAKLRDEIKRLQGDAPAVTAPKPVKKKRTSRKR